MNNQDQLQATIELLAHRGKGILAADESSPTIAKRFDTIGIESTGEQRRRYRSLILETPGLGDYISGIILFEETLGQQADDGTPLPELAARQGVVPGIKVDKGKGPLANAPGDEITRGLDGLEQRLEGYQAQGARFAKWRNVYHVDQHTPSRLAIEANAEVLARYAAVCQSQGIVPIVEPEVLMDGDHDMARCAEVSEAVLHALFHALHRHRVVLEHTLLKPSMITPGKDHARRASPDEVARETVRILRRTVPAALPSINFLSGGQTPEEATANLNAMNCLDPQPWELSFSYGRALQQPALQAWRGDPGNAAAAQAALYRRAELNGAARRGEYRPEMESSNK